MKLSLILIQLIIYVLLASCSGQNEQSTAISPALSYPPCISTQDNQSILPTPVNLPIKLSNGLTVEEYSSAYVAGQDWLHKSESGCRYPARNRAYDKQITLDNSFQILLSPVGDQIELITVRQGEQTIFETKSYIYVYSGLIEAWSYENHWVIEVLTSKAREIDIRAHDPKSLMQVQEKLKDYLDIIQDGKSLKDINGYKRVFSFQILNGRPFYFYEKGGKFGINYDGAETQLDYDSISWNRPHPGIDLEVFQFQNMVVFYASRSDESFRVALGAFDK